MARLSRSSAGASKSFTWTTVFYLLLVLIAPMALFGTGAQAENETDTEEYGSVIGIDLGTTYSYVCPCIVLTIPMERS
jgi:heat shock protein 5